MKKIPNTNMRLEPKGAQLPRVMITLEAFQKIRAWAAICPVEINGLGYVERRGNDFLISDVFILKQKAGSDQVDMDDAAIHDLTYQLARRGMSTVGLRLEWHSHARHEVFFSEKDLYTINRQQGDYLISLVVNKRGEYVCRLDLYRPFRAAFMVDIEILLPLPDEALVEKCRQDFKELVELPLLSHRLPQAINRVFGTPPAPVLISDISLKEQKVIHQDQILEEAS
jgi:hypothetical protein